MDAPTIALAGQVACYPSIPSTSGHCIDMTISLRHASPSIDKAYPAYGGIFREEAILLLRRFYVQENQKGKYIPFGKIS